MSRRLQRSMLALLSGIALVGLLSFAGCSSSEHSLRKAGQIQHVVMCWLKEPGNEEGRKKVIEASFGLRSIPGVVDVHAGPPLPSERPVVDDSFDVGVVIVLEDQTALSRYLGHPTHKAAVAEVLGPLSERILIYDIVEE